MDSSQDPPCVACHVTCAECTALLACKTCKPLGADKIAGFNVGGECGDCGNNETNACNKTAATGCIAGYHLDN